MSPKVRITKQSSSCTENMASLYAQPQMSSMSRIQRWSQWSITSRESSRKLVYITQRNKEEGRQCYAASLIGDHWTAFYPIATLIWQKKAQSNLFSETDEGIHRQHKMKIANAFSMANLLDLEPAIDSCSILFMKKLHEFAIAGKSVDLGSWLWVCTVLLPVRKHYMLL